MRLLRAAFKNFRMLRDLELEFSHDRKLTVIRAANESGKTTVLHGLQWALYGDAALPAKGQGFRLHPIDWNVDEAGQVLITATVEFELTKYRRTSGKVHETHRRYRLIRSVTEDVDSEVRRPRSTVKLFALNETGSSPIEEPEALINDELPSELREVFFTDGDRALSFIEADAALATKRKRVQQAIRSLLGLAVIEDAIRHVGKSAAEVNKKAKQIDGSSALNRIATRLGEIEDKRTKAESDLEDARQQFVAFDEKLRKVDRQVDEALKKGNKEELRKHLERTRTEIRQLDEQLTTARKAHSDLFRSRLIAADLLAPLLAETFDMLDGLRDQGKIPNTTIPILHHRLEVEVCICGETLKASKASDGERREHIRKLIHDSERADEVQELVTELYFGAKPLHVRGAAVSSAWLDQYNSVLKRRDGMESMRVEAGRKLRKFEIEIDSLPDTDIKGLRETQRQYKQNRDRYLRDQSVLQTQLTELRRRREADGAERDRLLREQKKGVRILADLAVAQDVEKVLKGAYERITNEEVDRVSEMMNSVFLEMIGADPEQGAIIQRTEISRDFDILVYGPEGRALNPDRDLNGASRRALTLSFILALTKVSEVEAPNVIDTPLGMTSGFVKRSVLRTAIRESSQLILFLTHDEIAGCEEIIDDAAGSVVTLTNPAHYPKMLVNDPGVVERKVLRCDCDHRSVCQLCERRPDTEIELDVGS